MSLDFSIARISRDWSVFVRMFKLHLGLSVDSVVCTSLVLSLERAFSPENVRPNVDWGFCCRRTH